jgi:hypothetical protein
MHTWASDTTDNPDAPDNPDDPNDPDVPNDPDHLDTRLVQCLQ